MIERFFILGPPAEPLEATNAVIAYTPNIQPNDKRLGYMRRYFVQKRNELNILVEISEDSYNKYGNKGGIDPVLYKAGSLKWKISGTPEQIAVTNRDTLALISVDFPGIQTLFTNLSEFAI